MKTAKQFEIPRRIVVEAYRRVKSNKGSAGVDGVGVEKFEENLRNNLYKIWNRMSSGSYFPPPVLVVEIPKSNGKIRRLGVPTVGDRIAQMIVKMYLEPKIEPVFHKDSYGYRPRRGALDAVGKARERCWKHDWVIDMDIKGFFDNIDHELMLKAVKKHENRKWILLYIERWLKAPAQEKNGNLAERTKGTPQGGVISPLLANLFLHYAFDRWMRDKHRQAKFERYADDIIVHCDSEQEAIQLKKKIQERLENCKLELSAEKTKIVYCKDDTRTGENCNIQFDFLGYTFRPRVVKTWRGTFRIGFNPAVSQKGKKALRDRIRQLKIPRKTWTKIDTIAELLNPIIRGWMNYYGRFYQSEAKKALHFVDVILIKWAVRTFKRFNGKWGKSCRWISRIAKQESKLFTHWKLGIKPVFG